MFLIVSVGLLHGAKIAPVAGPNDLLNKPALLQSIALPTGTFIAYSLHGLAGQPFRITYAGGDRNDVELIRHGVGVVDGTLRVEGTSGDDRISGGKGNDVLVGGDRDDRLEGHQGRDLLIGGKGEDRLTGNAGRDWFFANLNGQGVLDLLIDLNGSESADDL